MLGDTVLGVSLEKIADDVCVLAQCEVVSSPEDARRWW
jgi:hypothetical protein